MSSQAQHGSIEKRGAIHKQYMDILNCLSDAVYWIDTHGQLLGSNSKFVQLMGLNRLRDLEGTPYYPMIVHAQWQEERVESLKLDDMNVLFSRVARHNVEEKPIIDTEGRYFYFNSTRVPMYNEHEQLIGLIVVLTERRVDQKELLKYAKSLKSKPQMDEIILKNHPIPQVLMIEDNVIAQNVESALLKTLNCCVDIADTGDMALKLFDPGKYDLVLMDIGLEDTSGYVVAKQLRHKEKDTEHRVPIIALTGYEADVVKYDCEHYCMEGAITKPLTGEQAEQMIKHYVYHMDVEVPDLKKI